MSLNGSVTRSQCLLTPARLAVPARELSRSGGVAGEGEL